MNKAPRFFLIAAVLAACCLPAAAQTTTPGGRATLYVGMIQSKGYVVGAPLMASGLQRHDGDTTWTHLGWNTPRVVSIAYDPSHPETMYLASGNGVLATDDGGASWRIATDWRVTEVRDVAVDAHAPENVYLASGYGVWRSGDRGHSWHEANSGLPPPGRTYTEALEADRSRAGRLLAGTQDGVYVTTDGARSWHRAGLAGIEILELQQSRSNPDLWMAATFRNGLFLSTDGGQSWKPGPKALAGKTIHAVAIDPNDPRHLAAVGWETGVYVSRDGGRNWKRRGTTLPTDRFYETVFDANVPGRLWVATLEEGVFHSDDDGRTWTSADLYGTLVFDMLFVYPPGE